MEEVIQGQACIAALSLIEELIAVLLSFSQIRDEKGKICSGLSRERPGAWRS